MREDLYQIICILSVQESMTELQLLPTTDKIRNNMLKVKKLLVCLENPLEEDAWEDISYNIKILFCNILIGKLT
jgi:hypothetical protein